MQTAPADKLPYQMLDEREAKAFTSRLEHVSTALFQDDHDALAVLQNTLLAPEYTFLSTYADEHTIDLTNRQAAQQLIREVLRELQNLPRLTIRLATQPRYAYQQKLTDWFARFGPAVCQIQFICDPTIVGGMVIEYNGTVYDYSLKTRLGHVNLPTVS